MKFSSIRFLFVAIVSLPLVTQAARPLGPPIAEFFKPENRVACGVVFERLANNEVKIRVTDYLFQSDDEVLTLGIDAGVYDDVKVGTEYVFVFTRLRKNLLLRDEWELNPGGPALVKARGLGTPAIYTNSAATSTLLTPPGQRDELSKDTETLMLLEVAADDSDRRARELAIFELYLRRDLQGTISGDNAERYATLTSSADPRLRNFLLQGARFFPEERRTSWLGHENRESVAAYGTVLELNSDIPLLIKNSLLGLREEGTVDDLELIGKHLYSNAPGVARAALTALDAIDPQMALVLAQRAVLTDKIHLVTRRGLTTYIKKHTGV